MVDFNFKVLDDEGELCEDFGIVLYDRNWENGKVIFPGINITKKIDDF